MTGPPSEFEDAYFYAPLRVPVASDPGEPFHHPISIDDAAHGLWAALGGEGVPDEEIYQSIGATGDDDVDIVGWNEQPEEIREFWRQLVLDTVWCSRPRGFKGTHVALVGIAPAPGEAAHG